MTETQLRQFRDLILDLRDGREDLGMDSLAAWLEPRSGVLGELRELGGPQAHRRAADHEVLWGLYALSRLIDILIAPHQPASDDPKLLAWTTGQPWWIGAMPQTSVWAQFSAAIGATAIEEEAFHPFFHEIVEVVAADDPDEQPVLVRECWPGAMIGSLVLVRGGLVVSAGANVLDPRVASRSCLYSSWWRRNRVVRDLSHGWGHNSQWRTDFRRDYFAEGGLHYQVDARYRTSALPPDPADPSPEQLRELVRFRHSTTVDLGDDQWPYYTWFSEPRTYGDR